MDKLRSDRVLRRFLQLEVYDKIVHTQEEMLAHQRETGRDRSVQVRRIVVATVQEARAIKEALEGGDDFDAWASHNLLDETQLEGGRYLIKDELYPRILQEKVFPLASGQFSEPVLFNDQFGVYEVTAEVPVKLSVVQSVIEGRAAQGEAAAGRTGAVGSLAAGTRLCGSRPSLGERARPHWAGC